MTLNITLPPSLETFVQSQVQSGAYRDVDEVMRAALAHLYSETMMGHWTTDELRAAVAEGDASGPGIPLNKVVAEFEARWQTH